MKTLESRDYRATEADIETLARGYVAAQENAGKIKGDWLKSLVAGTQAALGTPVRQRHVHTSKPGKADLQIHLQAATRVHRTFYTVLKRVVAESAGGDLKLIARRTNFARTAKYALVTWIKFGGDVTALAAHKIKKHDLAVTVRQAQHAARGIGEWQVRVTKRKAALVTDVTAMLRADKAAAVIAIHSVMGELAGLLGTAGQKPMRDAEKAIALHMPFTARSALYVPSGQQRAA